MFRKKDRPSVWDKFWDKFFTMFYEDDSLWWSSMRFSFIFTMLLSNLCVWLTWLVISICEGKMVDIPQSVLALYGIANGIGFGSKLRQKGKELSVGTVINEIKEDITNKENNNKEEEK